MLPEVESIAVLDGDQTVGGNRLHGPEGLQLGWPQRRPRTRDETGRIDEMLVSPLMDVDLRRAHGVDQEPRSPCMIQLNGRHHDRLNLLGPQSEPVERL